MKSKVYINIVILVFLWVTISCQTNAEISSRIHSRKRRYLTFPEGASFQLVYDQIIPIIDYTNLFIFGVTCGLAWPLPSEPIDFAKLRKLYENSTLPDIRRQDDDDDVDNGIFTNELSKTNLIYDQKDAYYKNNRYYSKPQTVQNKGSTTKLNPVYGGNDFYYKNRGKENYPSTKLYNQIDGIVNRPFKPWEKSSSWGKTKRVQSSTTITNPTRKHFIYPVIGKRSVRELDVHQENHHEERLALHHHRSTRHALYESIERYLEAHNQNGSECVRKALCETAQRRRRDTEPGTFVGELLRVIFSLPDLDGEILDNGSTNRVRREYDEAFHGENNDCEQKYSGCQGSIWKSWYTQ